MALSKSPGDEPDLEEPGNWSNEATVKKEDYFNRYLDGKQSPGDAAFEPDLKKLLTNLYDRQRHEAYELLDRTTGAMQLHDLRHNESHVLQGGGCAPETLKIYKEEFRKEYREQCQGFAAERERYISDFQKAREIRDQMEQDSPQDTLEQSLEHKPKLTS